MEYADLLRLDPTVYPGGAADKVEGLIRATAIGLGNRKLSSLPDSLRKLTNIKRLTLGNNKLTSLPEFLSELTDLRTLHVFQNPMESLPEFITRFKNLVELQIESRGYISIKRAPSGISTLPCWRNTHKDDDMFYSISASLGKLKLFTSNEGSGMTNPKHLFREWYRTEDIIASHNMLTVLPEFITFLTHVNSIDISHNKLQNLPDGLSNLRNLTLLNVSNNELSQLPESILKCTSLKSLNISNNTKISEVPKGITSLVNLEVFLYTNGGQPMGLDGPDPNIFSMRWYKMQSGIVGGESTHVNHAETTKIVKKIKKFYMEREFESSKSRSRTNSSTHSTELDRGLVITVDNPKTRVLRKEVQFNAIKAGVLCLLCMDCYTEPMQLRCGHIFCKRCISPLQVASEAKPAYRCPICHEQACLLGGSMESVKRLEEIKKNADLFRKKIIDYTPSEELFVQNESTDPPTQENGEDKPKDRGIYDQQSSKEEQESNEPKHTPKNLEITLDNLVHPSFCPDHNQEISIFCSESGDFPLKCPNCMALDYSELSNKQSITHVKDKAQLENQIKQKQKVLQEKVESKSKLLLERQKSVVALIREYRKQYDQSKKGLAEHITKIRQKMDELEKSLNKQLDTIWNSVNSELQYSNHLLNSQLQRVSIAGQLLSELDIPKSGGLRDASGILTFCHRAILTPSPDFVACKWKITTNFRDDLINKIEEIKKNIVFRLSADGAGLSDSANSLSQSPESSDRACLFGPVAIDAKNGDIKRLFVAEKVKSQLLEYLGSDMQKSTPIHTKCCVEKGTESVADISLSSSGLFAVADSLAKCVKIMSQKGNVERVITEGLQGRPINPTSVALDSSRKLYVVDNWKQIIVYEDVERITQGNELTVPILKDGANPILSVAVDEKDQLLVLRASSKELVIVGGDMQHKVVKIVPVSAGSGFALHVPTKGFFCIHNSNFTIGATYDYNGNTINDLSKI